jgi:hypothetical protein
MVWEDWREIRARPYASFSTDFGQTWTPSASPLPHAPGKNTGLSMEIGSLYADGDGYNVIAEEANDAFKTKQLVRIAFGKEDLRAERSDATAPAAAAAAPAVDTTSDASDQAAEVIARSEAALRERIDSSWQAMVEARYAEAYRMYDPFFRARNDLETFEKVTGRIKYSEYEIKDVQIDGAIAEVAVRIKASVPPFVVETTGEEVSKPEQELTVDSQWLWIDGDWYREFRLESQDMTYTGY